MATGEIVTFEPAQLTTAALLQVTRDGGKIRLPELDGDEQAFAIMEDKVTAATADELFADAPSEVLKPSEIIGQAFTLKSVEFRNSDLEAYPDSIGIFAILHVELDGRPETLISGSTDVVLKCIRAIELEALPRALMITETKTKSGRSVQNLVAAVGGPGEAF